MHRGHRAALIAATAAAAALIPAASAVANGPNAARLTSKERAAEARQNTQIKKVAAGLRAVTVTVGTIAGIDDRLKTIEGAAPQIITGLGQLKTGLETVGAGLTALKTLAGSTEYGIGQVFVGATPAAGAFLVTPDIPDAVQQAQTSGTFIAGNAGLITVRVGVRSAESDGDGTIPAAHCRVTVTGPGATLATTSKPNAALGGAPFYPINTKSALTSTETANAGFPFGPKSSGTDADTLVDLTDIGGSGNATTPLGPGTESTAAGAGQMFTVQLACVDTSASSTDPSA